MGDRESDIFELFERQAERAAEAGLLVRVHLGRQRKVRVWDAAVRSEMIRPIEAQPDFEQALVTGRKVEIESQGGARAREKRTAVTEIRIGPVAVLPPKERAGQVAPLPAWLVRVLEPDPPPGEEGLEWLLLSSEGAATAQWAERIVSWYERRWGIEEYFRLLKTGTRIEDRRLRDAEALGKCLVFDVITAWRVFSLDRYARDAPETPADGAHGGRAGGDRGRHGGGAVAAAAGAGPAGGTGHSQLGRAAGAHAGLASEETPGTAGERGAVAGVPATANDGALPAVPAGAAVGDRQGERRTLSRRHCRGSGILSAGPQAGSVGKSLGAARSLPAGRR